MKKIILVLFILNFNFIFSQTKSEIEALIITIARTENSKEIAKTGEIKKILLYGKKALPILSGFFTDREITNVYSDCAKRKLSKGEIAIIIADHIRRMPYFQLTGIQNCTLSHCEKNPNLIEYYFQFMTDEKLKGFKNKYDEWLAKSQDSRP